MPEYYSLILESIYHDENTDHKVFVEAIINEDSEYTGRYRVTIDGNITTELTWREDDIWEETGKGETERAKVIGNVIATYEE